MPNCISSGYKVIMKTLNKQGLIVALLMLSVFDAAMAQKTFSDPDETASDIFWKQLYADGGVTFFCQKPFTGKSFLVTQGYIYPMSYVRNALHCGTPSQCERESEKYRYIASDLHNMIPVQNKIEMRRRNAEYAQLGERVAAEECGIRAGFQNIEPPDRIKGDVARSVFYMVKTYDLPLIGADQVFANWDKEDPPDDSELARNKRIKELQGNDNPFISSPDIANNM